MVEKSNMNLAVTYLLLFTPIRAQMLLLASVITAILNCPNLNLLGIVPDAEMPLAIFSPFAHHRHLCHPC